MSDFTQAWQATCPRCSTVVSNKSYSCNNCGKGTIDAKVFSFDREKTIYLGCNVCKQHLVTGIQCTQCGTKISTDLIKTPNVASCFIATAVFQDPDHPTVRALRSFRDDVLSHTALGSKFIDWYYVNGPRMAVVFEKSPLLRAPSKMVLNGFASLIKKKRTKNSL